MSPGTGGIVMFFSGEYIFGLIYVYKNDMSVHEIQIQ